MSATRYYQVLRRLIDDPDAMKADPLTTKRMQRLRDVAVLRRLERINGSGA